MPLINIIVSNTADPPSLVKVHDCSKQLANNGTKNTMYIVSVFTPWITRLDLHGNQLDLCLVDRARNMQNAVFIVETMSPRFITVHTGNYDITLFFNNITKLKSVKVCFFLVYLLIISLYLADTWLFH